MGTLIILMDGKFFAECSEADYSTWCELWRGEFEANGHSIEVQYR